jgi:ABC-type multidrug transport system ATPase subunit
LAAQFGLDDGHQFFHQSPMNHSTNSQATNSHQAAGLSVDGLSFSYPNRLMFDGWSHEFSAGLTWVRGHNGCGKSTLLQILGGALKPMAGQLKIGDIDESTDALGYRKNIYWCSSNNIVFDHLKPLEYFGFLLDLYPKFDKSVITEFVNVFNLHSFLNQRISKLSSGTQKKVAVVAALAVNTQVVLLDEPLATLDQTALQVLRGFLAEVAVKKNQTWIITSHEAIGDAQNHARLLELSGVQSF